LKEFNKGKLKFYASLPGETGAVATALQAQINDVVSELATVYKGGNASTDESLRLAKENLEANWNKETFERAIKELKKTLQYRVNSINTTPVAGLSQGSPYTPQGQGQQSSGVGNSGQNPQPGTPSGWSLLKHN